MAEGLLAASLLITPQWSLPIKPVPVVISTCDLNQKSKECVTELIKRYAELYDVSLALAMEVADCESDFRADIYGDSGKAYGIYQFHRPTFEMFSKKLGEKLDYFDVEDNIRLAIWALANDRGHHWSCYRKAALK